MHKNRLGELQAQIVAYQLKTRENELVWRPAAPVPTSIHSQYGDFYFESGRFEVGDEGARVALFAKQRKRLDLRDPQAYVLVVSQELLLDDLLLLFKIHKDDADTGELRDKDRVIARIIKGVVPDHPKVAREAERFNMYLNRELARLYHLGAMSALKDGFDRLQQELEYLNDPKCMF